MTNEILFTKVNKNPNLKKIVSTGILFLLDISMIFFSLVLAYLLRNFFVGIFDGVDSYPLENYTSFYMLYIVIMGVFVYEGIYVHRYDFWHESEIIVKGLLFSLLIILAYLAMTKSVEHYSRAVILLSFLMMSILIPASKNIGKKLLYNWGLWRRGVKIYGNDSFLQDELYINHYLGYVDAGTNKPETVFINSKNEALSRLKEIIDEKMESNAEVIFIPLMNDYDLTKSPVYKLSNTHTNLIVFKNDLKKKYKLWIKKLSDVCMVIILLPLLSPLLLFIAYKIRKEEPNSSVLFKQDRLGKDGKVFTCYKFRTMFEESDDKLDAYLSEHPEEVTFYETYHKYQNDPRITKIGNLLRKTSLDELPQIFNVLKNEMSFIGPRPYMVNEKEAIGKKVDTILAVKPGITGLWQVSGRNDVDFKSRVVLDIWYIRNWNLWLDVVILFKTVKIVFLRKGAS